MNHFIFSKLDDKLGKQTDAKIVLYLFIGLLYSEKNIFLPVYFINDIAKITFVCSGM